MSARIELAKAFADEAEAVAALAEAGVPDDDVLLRNAYVLGATLMRDNIVSMFASGAPLHRIKALYPPEPDVDHLRALEAERRASIAGN